MMKWRDKPGFIFDWDKCRWETGHVSRFGLASHVSGYLNIYFPNKYVCTLCSRRIMNQVDKRTAIGGGKKRYSKS